MVCGLATEAWSRPQRTVIEPNSNGNDENNKNNNAPLFEIYQDRWEGDYDDDKNKKAAAATAQSYNYNWNFVRRMLPHVFGYIPMAGAWVMIIKLVLLFDLNVLTSSSW